MNTATSEAAASEEFSFAYNSPVVSIAEFNPAPRNTLTSSNAEGKQIGELDFSADKMTFVGDADESAKVFINAVLRMMPQLRQGSVQ